MTIVYTILIILGMMCAGSFTAIVCAIGYWIFQQLMEDAEKARARARAKRVRAKSQ